MVVTEGSRARKEELGGTTLEVPQDSKEKSWEGVFKNTCSHTFSVPKSKATASCAVLEVRQIEKLSVVVVLLINF